MFTQHTSSRLQSPLLLLVTLSYFSIQDGFRFHDMKNIISVKSNFVYLEKHNHAHSKIRGKFPRFYSTATSLSDYTVSLEGVKLSTLKGKALLRNEVPSLSKVKTVIGPTSRSTLRSLSYAALDVTTLCLCAWFGLSFILPMIANLSLTGTPLNSFAAGGLWLLYSLITGTVGIGMWVTAHECGHGAFSDNRWLQTAVGYVFHSILLVPYFSWQRSHALHHANTNHITDGETHVPPIFTANTPITDKTKLQKLFGNGLGERVFGGLQLVVHLLIGWPAYLLLGATGGPSRGVTNHFIPLNVDKKDLNSLLQLNKKDVEKNEETRKPLKELFPSPGLKLKVLLSDIGVGVVLAGLCLLAQKFGSGLVLAAYGGPLLVVNAWLVAYTWLQHTEVDVPHLPAEGHSFIKGAFLTVDRPYGTLLGGLVDFLHHHIGTTHVVHHIDSTIPHYEAVQATQKLASAFPQLYLFESTPIHKALWRIASHCYGVEGRIDSSDNSTRYVFTER